MKGSRKYIRLPPELCGKVLRRLARRDGDMKADINLSQHRDGEE